MRTTSNTPAFSVEELKSLQAEIAELKNAETRLRKLVEQSRDGIVILDSDCKVFDANQKFADMIGYTLNEVYNLYVWDWDKTFTPEIIRELALDVDESGHHFETVHTRKDNSKYDVELSNSGTIVGGKKLIFCICRDITGRKQHEAQLKESQEQLTTFIDNIQGIAYQIMLSDIDTFTPRLFRGAIEKITGYNLEEFSTKKNWNNLIHPDDLGRVKAIRNRFQENPDFEAALEYRCIAKDESLHWVKEHARLVKIGNTELLHGTIFDITQQKQAEEEKLKLEEQIRHSQKLEAIGTLAGGVAHDFNNILSIIMGYSDIAIKTIPEKNPACSYIHQISKACNRAKDIIQQLLAFSRKVDPKKSPFNVEPVITEVLTFLRSTLPSNIEIRQNLNTDNEIILADPTQIHQVIMNLCVNSAQSIENREGIITVTASSVFSCINNFEACVDLPEGHYIKIEVIDNGPGIQPEIADRIFDPYFTTRSNSKGSGMGLSVVLGIVHNHGGCITMNSRPASETTFTVYLPVVNIKTKVSAENKEAPCTGAESILFVDDEEDITIIGKLLLEDQGFRVQTEVNPLNALNAFRNNPDNYDLIFTDMTMPNLTGDALFREVRKICPGIPVILCTGHSDYINQEDALAMGASAYVNKPLRGKELVKVIRYVLDKSKDSTLPP